MVIILKGADASTNNIGKIEIPIIIDDDIKALLGNFSKNLSNIQQNAVQVFIKSLRTSGVMDKLRGLYMPILAGRLDESFVNCSDNSGFAKDATPNISSYELTAQGLRRYSSGNEIILNILDGVVGNNFSFFALANSEDKSNIAVLPSWGYNASNRIAFSKGGLNIPLYVSIGNSYVGGYQKLSTLIDGTVPTDVYLKDNKRINDYLAYSFSFNGRKLYFYEKDDSEKVEELDLNTDLTGSVSVLKIDKSGFERMYSSHCIFAIGEGLTKEQLIALGEAAKRLKTIFD